VGLAVPVGRYPAAARVRKRKEFQAAQASGTKVVTRRFVFLFSARKEGDVVRLGITASRKVGNAVVRNRAKRLVREAFRSTRTFWRPGIDMIVIVRGIGDDPKLGDVVAEWRDALPRFAKQGFAQRGMTQPSIQSKASRP
jgi:ribonuclease P protein component